MADNINSLNSTEPKRRSKSSKFIENTKRAINKALATAGIAASTMGPISTPSVIPASVNTINALAPIASTTSKIITLGTAASLVACCENPDPIEDTTPPTIDLSISQVDITGGKEITIKGNKLFIGNEPIASWNDNITKNCSVKVFFNGDPISSGDTINNEGTLTIQVSDDAGNVKTANLKINMIRLAPNITVDQPEVNIFGWEKVNIDENKLLIGDEIIASREDEDLETCKISLNFNGQKINPGDIINSAGTLTLTITNKYGKSANIKVTITNDAIYGIENLKQSSMKVGQEVNLLEGITFAKGVELLKTEIEMDGEIYEINDPYHYIPQYPGICTIIFTLRKNENTTEIVTNNLTISPLEYKGIEIKNIQPVEILPIIGQIETGDKKVYEYIEHLKIAESTKIRDMMRKYGAGNHDAEEYKQLMMRLNTGMTGENPLGYNNYETIGGEVVASPSTHARNEWFRLDALIDHANLKVICAKNITRENVLIEFIKNNPNSINIFGNSAYSDADNKAQYNKRLENINNAKDLFEHKNIIVFSAGTNIENIGGILKNKIYNGEYDADEQGMYSLASLANSDKNTQPNSHLLVTIATNKNGNIDQTGMTQESSKYPIGFSNEVLFSGRGFIGIEGNTIYGDSGRYPTSTTNYYNVAVTDLCFQMFAEVNNVDELLEMIRSTCLTDYIKLDGKTQELQLINPAGFINKYLMPTDLPTNLKSDQIPPLNKGYYKGIVFDIPGAEVNINGERIIYNDTNKSLIKNQNPFNLEWRINGDLCRKLGYKGKTLEGKVIVVDDQRNGLNIDKKISLNFQY